jgi:hypothetical protein
MPADPRNVDKKVPTWDGDPEKWDSFRDSVKWHFRKTIPKERAGVAAHVAGNVTGKAWEHINRLSEDDKDALADQGIDSLMKFFKDGLLENPIPEAGKHFRDYVYKFRREKGESMKQYTARHMYQLTKLETAMQGLKTSKVTLWETVQWQVQKYLDAHPISKKEIDLDLEEEEEEEDEDAEDGEDTKSVRSSRSVKSSESLKGFPQQKEGGDEDTRSEKSQKSRKSRTSSREEKRRWPVDQGGVGPLACWQVGRPHEEDDPSRLEEEAARGVPGQPGPETPIC